MQCASRERGAAGFSIIELLIAIIIIGILVAVIIPVLMRRAEDARIAAAESDLQHLQDAEERVGIHTGYMFRFYALDDTIGGDRLFDPFNPADLDGVRDEDLNNMVVQPTRMFIQIRQARYPQANRQARLLSAADARREFDQLTANETAYGWAGPYVNVHRLRDVNHDDLPEDPWGNEYLLFVPEGVVNMRAGRIDETLFFFATDVGSTVSLTGPFFDRFTVLSYGPNGAPGDATSAAVPGTDDDLKRQF
jgi:prepilin-type N-terminal cleavage/methylation domain-containing protein